MPPSAGPDSVRLVLGPQYEAGGFRSFFWGDHYRAAWTSPVTLPVLDLEGFAGGLTPERTAGGSQTTSLILIGAGRRYMFRLIDKDPTRRLPEELRDEPMVEFLQDQVSSLHPFSVLVVDALEDAAGVLHPDPSPFVMPDDPALGEFREEFAGRAGVLVERLGEEIPGGPVFEDLAEVIDGDDIFERLSAGRVRDVDARAFLAARLLDMLIGDWNRHRGQWSWGRRPGDSTWVPIALDRDHAFSRRDGLVPSVARFFVRGFVGFDETYSSIYDLHHEAREVDRRFLAELERPTWDSVALAVHSKLTNEVIDEAVRRLPEPLYRLDGEVLARSLKQRRDDLPKAASDLYDLLSEDVEIHLADGPEEVSVTTLPGNLLAVVALPRRSPAAIRPAGSQGVPATSYRRIFDPAETDEIWLFLGGGDDIVRLAGVDRSVATRPGDRRSPLGPVIRIVGGAGDDEVSYDNDALSALFYDSEGTNRVTGRAPTRRIISKPYHPNGWRFGDGSEENSRRPIHSGGWLVPYGRLDFSSDFGLFLGMGTTHFDYGFRRDPYETRLRLFGGIATQGKFHIEAQADFRSEASRRHLTLEVIASELDVVNFFGFGNDTRRFTTSDSADARRRALSFRSRLGSQLSRHFDIGGGAAFELSRTRTATNPFLAPASDVTGSEDPIEGSDGFTQVELFADARFDTRNDGAQSNRGAFVLARVALHPGLLDVGEAYGSLELYGSTYLSAEAWPLEPTLALRAGTRKVFGDFPFFDAAIVGGRGTLRGYDSERFAGDLALFGAAELRLSLVQPRTPLLGDVGVLGFADVGRVYFDGESPGGWHSGYGGGIWISFPEVSKAVSVVIARGEEVTRVYAYVGMPF
jgi:hypothetical protein